MSLVKCYTSSSINLRLSYPIVTAYEFEFLKQEDVVKNYMTNSSVYMIVKRPLLVINNFHINEEQQKITFEIHDDKGNAPLKCEFPYVDILNLDPNSICIQALFYKKTADTILPYDTMAGFKILDEKTRDVIVWYSPQKFIYEFVVNKLPISIEGEIINYIDYEVLYIGKAFNQKVWDRLTGHNSFQKILTLESTENLLSLQNSFEISLLILELSSATKVTHFAPDDRNIPENAILLDFEDAFEHMGVTEDKLTINHTNDVEALLIRKYMPEYNNIMYENYPNIQNGMRDLGYSNTDIYSEDFPAILYTEFSKQEVE